MPISRVLDVRAQLSRGGVFEKTPIVAADRAVLAGSQALLPDTVYPSEKNKTLRYYLPGYRVSSDEQHRPMVELRFKAGDDDEVGRLTVTMTWTLPVVVGVELRPVDHVANLTLRYRVPIEGGAAAATGWEHTVPLQPLQITGHLTARSTTIFREKSVFDTVYQALRSANQGATLDILIRAQVGVQTWRQVIIGRPTEIDQAAILKHRGVLFTDMVHKESLATVKKVPAAGGAKIRIAAAPPEVVKGVDATRAVVVRPELRRAVMPMRVSTMAAIRMSPAALHVATPAVTATPAMARMASPHIAVAPRGRVVATPTVAAPIAATAQPARAIPAAKAVFSPAAFYRVNTPKLSQAVAASDLKVAGQSAVPLRVALDALRQPAVVDATLENQQSVPFHYDPSKPEHRDVFAVEGFDSGGIHLLLPLRLTAPNGAAHVVYQDNLMREVVHVAPSEFRLERESTPPFLPALSFVASEFSTAEGAADEEASVLFRVTAVYRLEPWMDPEVVELTRAELARQGLVARFTTGMSHDAKLSLDLDLLGDEQQRDEASVDPEIGITDSLDLDHNGFVRLWRERLANPASGGVSGRVDYRLFDGSTAQVKVRLSLWEPSSALVDVTVAGPVADVPGRYRVIIRNRIESPVRITALPADAVEGGAMAHAVDAGSIVGQLLQPQESREVAYDITGTPTDLSGFNPYVLARAEPNLPALLKLLMLTPGYTSLGFPLTVKAAAGAFAPPAAGAEALTGLLVEFDDGSRLTLGPSLMEAEVHLVGRLIDQILGTADDSQRYFYRVTNLHAGGEGARTGWLEGRGTAPLDIGTAVARLDF